MTLEPIPPTSRRIACAWFPHWPVQRRWHDAPHEAGRPLVVSRGGSRGHVVVACSPDLAARGVAPGMSLAEARALAVSAHTAAERAGRGGARPRVIEHDAVADRQALTRLAEWCHAFSPLVALADDCGDAVWLDVAGVAHLFGGEQPWLHRLGRELAALGWRGQLALADSHAAAWALARYRGAVGAPLWAPPGETATLLATAPVEALTLAPTALAALAAVGIEQVGQLAAVPRAALATRFGQAAVAQLDRLVGGRVDVLPTVAPAAPWEVSCAWDTPVAAHDVLRHVIDRLLEQLGRQLAEQQLGATRLAIRLNCPPQAPLMLELRLFQPSGTVKHWQELATLQLERARLPAPVSGITIAAPSTGRLRAAQRELFPRDDSEPEQQRQVGELVDRWMSRLGHQAVLRVALAPEAAPERSFRLTSAAAPRAARKSKTPQAFEPGQRPLMLLARGGQAARVWLDAAGAPAAFQAQATAHRLTRAWGPERIETGWWRGQPVARDYYRVETTTGHQSWLYRRLRDERWFLHGWFS